MSMRKELTERLVVSLSNQPVELGLVRKQRGVPALRILERLGLGLQLLLQPPRGLSELLLHLLHLGLIGSFGLLERLGVLHLALDQLLL
jgi:hypothetical protein